MNELDRIEKRVEREEALKSYQGPDRVVPAIERKDELEELKKTKPVFRATTGIKTLDENVDGFRKGQLIIVSGPTKHGKTALCQTFTKSFADDGHKVLWFSYELGYEELFEKFPMINLDFFVPRYLESGNLSWIEDRIVESKQKYGTGIVFIDHLDFLRDPEVLKGINLNLSSYVGGIVQKIKRMAVEHDVLIFMMSHIRKNNWTGKELPSAEELRDSGQIAQLADIVLMVMRVAAEKGAEEVYQGNDAWLGIMANRHNGRTKRIPITFDYNQGTTGTYRERTLDTVDSKPFTDW